MASRRQIVEQGLDLAAQEGHPDPSREQPPTWITAARSDNRATTARGYRVMNLHRCVRIEGLSRIRGGQ
jgi:hypothetical protein